MKNLIFLFLFLPLGMQGQVLSSMTDLIDSIQEYSLVNDVAFKRIYDYTTRKAQIFAADLPIDTTGLKVNSIFLFYYCDNIYFNTTGNSPQKKLKYNLTDKNITTFDYAFDYDSQMIPYVIDDEKMKIYLLNPETGKHTLFADFWDDVSIEKGEKGEYSNERFMWISFINSTCAFITLVNDDNYTIKYFLVNGINNKIPLSKQSILNARVSNEKRNVYEIKYIIVSDGEQYIKVEYSYNTDKNVNTKYAACILDLNFNYIGDALLNRNSGENLINGVNIQNKKMQYCFLDSYTDTIDTIRGRSPVVSYKHVIIPYKFNPTLEISMYKAYNNNLLTNEDVKGLEKYELGILRNLIFAKYNYAFTSEFYQAYFNLYEFYGNEKVQKSRVKDVNSKLTDIDKANIRLIKEAETK